MMRRYDEAIVQERRALELHPEMIPAHEFLGQAYEQKGLFREAIAAIEKAIALSKQSPSYRAQLAHVHASSGNRAAAEKTLRELIREAEQRYVSPYELAIVCAALGKNDQAFAWLEKAFEERTPRLLLFLNSDPRVDPLRSDPRFQDLLRRIGLPP